MKQTYENGMQVLQFEEPLCRSQAEELLRAVDEAGKGGCVCIDLSGQGTPGAEALAVLLAASNDCRRLGIEFRIRLPESAAPLASDLRLARHAVLENPGGGR